jgi:uncharacterized protein DUF11/beta-propeller repeat-containing protein
VKEVCVNEVHGNRDRLSQDRPKNDGRNNDCWNNECRDSDQINRGSSGVKLPVRAALAAVLLFAAAWITLASTSHLRTSASAAAPALPLQTVAADLRSADLPSADRPAPAHLTSVLSALPLMFEPNAGQSDPRVKFLARGIGSQGLGYGVFLTADGASMSLLSREKKSSHPRVETLTMKLAGASPHAVVSGLSPLPGKSNYLIGNDPSRWHRDMPQFGRVRYENIYPGINLVFYGNHGQMEYDFQVAPGSDPAQAELQFEGSRRIELKDGNLILHAENGSVRLLAPRIYQRMGDRQQPVEGRFQMRAANRVGFAIGSYDHSRELVIDPVLDYSTYFGGSGDEQSTSVAVDGSGNIYLAGSTTSTDLITSHTVGSTPFQATLNGTQNVYVLKINSPGTAIGFLTYLGGSGTDSPAGIAVDASGNPYLAGTTSSANFPTTPTNAYQAVAEANSTGTSHVFVTALSSTGSTLNYSSYLSGNGTDVASGMAIDAKGEVFVTGTTTSTDVGASNDQFPASAVPETPAYQQFSRAPIQFFVTKVNTKAFGIGSIPYSTYFGGGTPSNGIAVGGGITVDGTGNIYFSGTTNFLFTGQSSATDFPILDAYQPCLDQAPPSINTNPQTCTYSTTPTATDAFVAKLNPNLSTGSQLIWSTYFGGTQNDSSTGVAVDSGAANVFIVGTTNSSDITTLSTFGGYQTCLNTPPSTTVTTCTAATSTSPTDAFVARFNNLAATTTTTTTTNEVLTLSYFSYLGGSGNDAGMAVAVDSADDAFLTGWTQSTDFPTFPNASVNTACTVVNSNNPCVIQGHLNGTQDAFLAHLASTTTSGQNAQGAYATYFGGTGIGQGSSLAIDNNSNVYMAGDTNAPDFQTQNPLQPQNNGGYDAFVSKFGTEADLGVTGVITLPTAQSYVSAGNQATFTYTVTNSGPDLATQVTFSDDLSNAGMPLNFDSATAGSGSCSATTSNSTVVCTIAALQAGSSSTVTVGVTPTTSGNFTGGSVTVYSPGNNDPNPTNNTTSVSAQASDYSVAINPANQSIAIAGDTAVYQVTVAPINPYSSNISLTCCTNIPTGAKGTFSISTVTLSGVSPVSSQLNITTTARPVSNPASVKRARQFYALWLTLPGMAVVGFGWKSGRRRIVAAIAACLLFGMLLLQPACGGASTPTPTSGTPTGTYSLVATATSGSDTKNISFTLTVP